MQTEKKQRSRRIRACTLLEEHADEVEALFADWLNVITEALEAQRVVRGQHDEQLDLGPDHATRMGAARQFNELCLGCRRAPVEEPEKAPPMTLEYLEELLKKGAETRSTKPERRAKSKNPKLEGGNGEV